jgi:alpha-mannosidase
MIPPKVIDKLAKRIAKLEQWRYAPASPAPLEMAETMEHFRTPPIDLGYEPAPVGCRWGQHWGTVWFRGRAEVPRACRGRRVYYRHVSVGEKLLFVDGKPFAGMDPKHQEVLLLAYARGGESMVLDIEAYCGHPFPGADGYNPEMRTLHWVGGGPETPPPLTLEASDLVVERESVAALYYDANALYKTALILEENSLRRAVLLDQLNQALDLVPLHWETEEELDAAARQAQKHLAPLLKQRNAPTTPTIGITGYAHIDVGWLWPVRESIRKAARTFASMLNLMEDYGEFRFLQSQPVLYQMIEDHYPELLARIRKRVKEGRWEPNGGMWVEADCNVSGGESLVRQFLEGRKKTMELFGYKSDTLWLPDVFGYAAALPQILKLCGIENFVTSKINWNDTNRFPYDTFWWQGIDGTEIFTHYITTRTNGYNAQPLPEIMQETWNFVQQKELQDCTLTSVGWGDGGGGTTREMLEHAARIRDLEGCPKTEFVNVSLFLKQMRTQKVERPRWVGELYFELHRGTYTSQARTKRYMRKMELLLREVEIYSVMAMPAGFEYPAASLQKHWRTLLTNQFHDILPGSSIRKVYEDAEAEFAQMETDLVELRNAALIKIGAQFIPDTEDSAFVLANALSWAREEAVFINAPGYNAAVDAQGRALPAQAVDGGLYVRCRAESLGAAPIALRKKESAAASAFVYATRTLETPFYRVTFDKAGKITGLFDKDANREVVRPGKRLNDFYTAEDVPVFWDAWDIDRDYRDRLRIEDNLIAREVAADGPLCFVLRSKHGLGRRSTLTQDLIFYAHSRRIDFKTRADWQEKHTLLKVGFGMDVLAEAYRNEIQFGHALRPTHTNTSWDQARFEVCAHKWVDVSEGNYGVALLNDCKYGHDSLDDMISLTLLRSPLAPDELADQGKHEFTYALLPHLGGFDAETVVRAAYALNVPLTLMKLKAAAGKDLSTALCWVDNPNVIVEAVKKAENDDAVIVRVYEAGKTRGAAALIFARPLRKALECDLMEERDQTAQIRENSIVFAVRPFEIKTFKVYFR